MKISLNNFRAGVKGVVILTPLLGINWLFGLLAVNKHLVVFEFMFVLLNSLQGLFIFLFHCVGSSEVSQPGLCKAMFSLLTIYLSSNSLNFVSINLNKPTCLGVASYAYEEIGRAHV